MIRMAVTSRCAQGRLVEGVVEKMTDVETAGDCCGSIKVNGDGGGLRLPSVYTLGIKLECVLMRLQSMFSWGGKLSMSSGCV